MAASSELAAWLSDAQQACAVGGRGGIWDVRGLGHEGKEKDDDDDDDAYHRPTPATTTTRLTTMAVSTTMTTTTGTATLSLVLSVEWHTAWQKMHYSGLRKRCWCRANCMCGMIITCRRVLACLVLRGLA